MSGRRAGARRGRRELLPYGVLLGLALLVAVVASWTDLATRIDNDAYDGIVELYGSGATAREAVVVAVDERTLQARGGMRRLRGVLAEGLEALARLQPGVVAVDVILSDEGDPAEDARLEAALRGTPRLVLSADLLPDGRGWEVPLGRFAGWAEGVGHVHADQDPLDGVARRMALEKVAGRERRWALSLEALRAMRGMPITESPDDLQVGGLTVPSSRPEGRTMPIRFLRTLPTVPLLSLLDGTARREAVTGKAVFVGVTAQTAVRDRLKTPNSSDQMTPGVEIHAHAYETMAQGLFPRRASATAELLGAAAVVSGMGLAFWLLAGWRAYVAAAGLVLLAHGLPHLAFRQGLIVSTFGLTAAAWLGLIVAAGHQYFIARRDLRRSEDDKARYQQAIHFVTHEMRTPLTAIQGSSELMGRYALSDDKRKQMAQMINSESKRLARMVQTFLDIERLNAGQLALRAEALPVREWVESCVERVRPLAERKRIGLEVEPMPETAVRADRELLEYALYNLLTNAVKYSPEETQVTVGASERNGRCRVSVRDQGIGMDEQEVRQIFRKFYRTKRAEASGEVGTGIGLSIVEQIVAKHGGRIEVTSRPGQGSCFTVEMPRVG